MHLTRREHEGIEGGGHADTWKKPVPSKKNRRCKDPKVGVGPREPQRRVAVTRAEAAKGRVIAEEVTKVKEKGSERSWILQGLCLSSE